MCLHGRLGLLRRASDGLRVSAGEVAGSINGLGEARTSDPGTVATGTLRQLPLARPAYTHILLETCPCVIRLLCAAESFVLLKERQRL